MPAPPVDPTRLIREAGLRVTAIRVSVLDAVARSPHAEVDRIIQAVTADLGTVSRQGVYDTLDTLTAAFLVRRIEPAGSPARYETRVGDNHHHVVCRLCGAAADVDCALGAAPCLEPSQMHGFVLDEAEVTYWGICPRCQSRGSEETSR